MSGLLTPRPPSVQKLWGGRPIGTSIQSCPTYFCCDAVTRDALPHSMPPINQHFDLMAGEVAQGFYYSEKNKYMSVDVVPDISVHDDAAFVSQLTTELQPLFPGIQVVIVVDHNYIE